MSLTRPRSRRLSVGELFCLRLLLHNLDEALHEAITANTLTITRDAVKVAQIHLKTALELTKDSTIQ